MCGMTCQIRRTVFNMDKDLLLTILSMTGIFGILTKLLWDGISKRFKKIRTDQEALEKGVQALLRDRLICQYDTYRKVGSAPIHVKDSFENMYLQYHALGANGVMDSIREEFQKLPTEDNT